MRLRLEWALVLCAFVACQEQEVPTPKTPGTADVRVRWDAPFPRIPLTSLEGEDVEPFWPSGRWEVFALSPKPCVACDERYEGWEVQARVWREQNVGFTAVAERSAEDMADIVTRENLSYPVLTTDANLFRVTTLIDRPALVLVDPEGIVRYVGRGAGTPAEQLRSLVRHQYYLSAPRDVRAEILMRPFPDAARVDIRQTRATPWLSDDAIALGVSTWFGLVYGPEDDFLGLGLPVEQETNCDTCDPLYLVVGLTAARTITGIAAIEPIVSLGERVYFEGHFEAFDGARSDTDVMKVPPRRETLKADLALRDILKSVLACGRRWREAGLPR